MDSSLSPIDSLNTLFEEFLTRYRLGERPALSEYAARHPELAERIRALFPTLVLMEQCGPPHDGRFASRTDLPRQWGEYRLLREVGRGGMGVVYEAVQEALSRRVAVKVLPPALQHGKHRERFRREARTAARLHHTNIVPLFGVGEHEGVLFLVMQFIDGRGLDVVLGETRTRCGLAKSSPQTPTSAGEEVAADISRKAPTTVSPYDATPHLSSEDASAGPPLLDSPQATFFRDMAWLGMQAAEALAYAHSQGVLHRDIKPSNLLVDGQGTLWVADFGLAKTDDSDTLTERSEVVGTLRYLAPERFRGQCDARSDVYALSVTLYEMLTLRPAFEGDDRAELIERIVRQSPPRPRQVMPRLPLDLETIVLKAMAKEPAERYASAHDLADDLRCYLEDRPIRARRPTLRQKLARWSRRHKPIFWTAAISLLVLLVMSVAILAWSNNVISQERDQKEVALVKAKQNELTARRRFYAGQVFLAHQAWESKNPARVLDLLEELRPGPEEDDLRSFEWYYLWRLCRQGHRSTLKVPNSRTWCLAFSPNGKTLAAGCADASIRLWESATGRQLATWTGKVNRKIPCLAFAPDGKSLVAPGLSEPKSVTRWELATGQAKDVLNELHAMVQSMAFTPDGKILATGYDDGTISLWDTATWVERTTLRGDAGPVTSVAFSPDGRKLAAAVPWGPDNGRIHIWDWVSRTACASWKLDLAHHIAFSPNGHKLAAVGGYGFVHLYEASTGGLCASFHGHNLGAIYSVAFSPDGRTLASGSSDRTVRLWEVGTGQPRIFYADSGPVYAIAFSPDGQVLASAGYDGTITLRDAAPAGQELVLPDAGGFLAFSPDGKTLASAGTKALKLWDVATWKATTLPFEGTDPSESVAFSHDGKSFAVARGRTLKLFDVMPSRERATHDGPTICWSVAFSPDGKTLASARTRSPEISMWDLSTQQVRDTIIPDAAAGVRISAFSPDGTTLATGSQFGVLKVFDLATGKVRATLQPGEPGGMDWIFSLAFSPDSSLLASGGTRGSVKLWDTATGECRATLKGHVDSVLSLTFTSDGRTLATGGDDRTVKLWDVATGQERITLMGFKTAIRSVSFAANDRLLAAGSSDGIARVWHSAADPEALARRERLLGDKGESRR